MKEDHDPIFDVFELIDYPVDHDARVEPATFFTKDDGAQAICLCGWKGQPRLYEQDAEADILQHLRETEEA